MCTRGVHMLDAHGVRSACACALCVCTYQQMAAEEASRIEALGPVACEWRRAHSMLYKVYVVVEDARNVCGGAMNARKLEKQLIAERRALSMVGAGRQVK